MKNSNPCKDCSKREVGCHSTCENYISWKIAWNNMKAERHEQDRFSNEYIAYKRSRIK